MPRPSLKNARTEEIFDALMRTVARYGLEGATLARIAEEAGIARPLLRHYLGNREDMIAQFLGHVMERFQQLTQSLFDTLGAEDRLEALINTLFASPYHASENAAVFQALVAASERHNQIREPLLNFVLEFEARLTAEILREKPTANKTAARVVAAGLTGIYFNTDAITPLKPGEVWVEQQKQAALLLLSTL